MLDYTPPFPYATVIALSTSTKKEEEKSSKLLLCLDEAGPSGTVGATLQSDMSSEEEDPDDPYYPRTPSE